MTNYIDIDFETRCKVDLTEVGAWVYAEHESCDVLILRYHIDGKSYKWHMSNRPFPRRLQIALKTRKIRAHNVFFEWCIWNLCMHEKYNWPYLPIDQCECTQALVSTHSYQPSLEKAGEQLYLDVLKDKEGMRLINKFSKPSKKKDVQWNEPEDYPADFDDFDSYCDTDVKVQVQIADVMPRLSDRQSKSFNMYQHMVIKGVPVDLNMARGAISMVSKYLKYAQAEAEEIVSGLLSDVEFNNIRSRKQVMEILEEAGHPIEDTKKQTLDNYILDKFIPKPVRRLAELKKNTGKTSTSKYAAALRTAGSDSRVHGAVQYHLARTGRPAGRLIQVQNFFKSELPKWVDMDYLAQMIANKEFEDIQIIYGDLMNTLASACRSVIAAPAGKKFYVADYAQIECRIVFWLAGEKKALHLMQTPGEDIYCDMATDIYKFKVIKDEHNDERFMGKQAILGLGYQMAHIRFKNRLAEDNIDAELSFCKGVVKLYRNKYRKVKNLWYEMNDAAIEAVDNKGKKVYCADRKLYYKMEQRWLYCYLPSGRRIAYVEPVVRSVHKWGQFIPTLTYMGYDSFLRKWTRMETFGGKLLENAAQAITADIIDYGMEQANEAGYEIIFPVHDEAIAEVDENFGSLKEYEKILAKTEPWARGLPVVAEAWEGPRYKK